MQSLSQKGGYQGYPSAKLLWHYGLGLFRGRDDCLSVPLRPKPVVDVFLWFVFDFRFPCFCFSSIKAFLTSPTSVGIGTA